MSCIDFKVMDSWNILLAKKICTLNISFQMTRALLGTRTIHSKPRRYSEMVMDPKNGQLDFKFWPLKIVL